MVGDREVVMGFGVERNEAFGICHPTRCAESAVGCLDALAGISAAVALAFEGIQRR